MTMKEYQEKYPLASIETEELSHKRGLKTKGKTYEEIYGEEAGQTLRVKRRDSALKQMKDLKQIERRKETSSRPKTKEHIKKMTDTKREKYSKPWNTYRRRALEHYEHLCERCGNEFPEESLVVHHRDLNNVASELGNHQISNLMVLCKSCHGKLHNEISKLSYGFVGLSKVEKGMNLMLQGLRDEYGLDLNSEHFKDTPKRVARAYAEIFEGVKNTKEKIDRILSTAFTSDTNQMIVVSGINVFSMCPHHFLPVEYFVSVGYIPNGKVLGISKLPRLVELLAKRPVIQEDITTEIAQALMSIGSLGAAVSIEGKHLCMGMRGVKRPESVAHTSSMMGSFMEEHSTRSEFFDIIKDSGFKTK